MGILYVAAAFMVVPGLLLLFHRLSRPRAGAPTSLPPMSLPPTPLPPTSRPVNPPTTPGAPASPHDGAALHPSAGSVAEEAERWLRSQA